MNYSTSTFSVTSWGWDSDDTDDPTAMRRWRIRTNEGQLIGYVSLPSDCSTDQLLRSASAVIAVANTS